MVLEVLNRRFGFELDVWSIGVIIYILLCGRCLFWDKMEVGIFNEVVVEIICKIILDRGLCK